MNIFKLNNTTFRILQYHIMEHPENNEEYKGLTVNHGVSSQPIVNPYRRTRARKRSLTAAEYVEGIRKGDVSVLGQAVTLLELPL